MIAGQMNVGPRDQTAQAFDQLQRREGERVGAVGPRAPEGVEHAPVRERAEALLRPRRPGEGPAEMFPPLASRARHAHSRMQGEAIEVSTAGAGEHGRWRLGLPATHVVTGPGTEGHRALHGGAGAGSPPRSLLSQWIDHLPRWLGWGQAPALQQAQGLDPHGQQDIGDVLVGGGGGGVEEGRTAWIRTSVDTVEHEAVEVGGSN